jgi:hypothetical protein
MYPKIRAFRRDAGPVIVPDNMLKSDLKSELNSSWKCAQYPPEFTGGPNMMVTAWYGIMVAA